MRNIECFCAGPRRYSVAVLWVPEVIEQQLLMQYIYSQPRYTM